MGQVVIIGAGLTGLVAAERLQAAGRAALLLEREHEAGGCCRSMTREGFSFDLTGHLLHVARPETEEYLRGLGIWDRFVIHERQAAVMVRGRITPYPIQINTHGLGAEVRRDCLLGFVRAWAAPSDGEPADFRDWVLQRFGDGLGKYFFFPYNSKLFRAAPEELSVDWVGRYVPRPRLEDVIDGAFGLYRSPVGYNATFRYPAKGGIRLLPDAVAAVLQQLQLGAEVMRVHLGERWVELAGGERVGYSQLVFTGSLPRLLDMVAEPLPPEVAQARQCLRWVRVVNLVLGVDGTATRPEHWLYFPDPEIPFYRVGFPSNYGRVHPEGCHLVSLELSLDPKAGEPEAAAAKAEQALADLDLLQPNRVRLRHVAVIDPAYVVFDHHRREAVQVLRDYLESFGVLLAGRWAEWKYSAMEDAVLDGMAVARRLLEAEEHDS